MPTKEKAPKRASKKATQDEMFPPSKQDKGIEDAIEKVVDAQDQRMAWGRKEKEARGTLQVLLQKAGFSIEKGYKRGRFTAWLEADDVKAKARLAEETEGDGE